MKVHIIYNPYKTDTKILINNRPIAKHSKLTKYSNVPFYAWCLQILNDIFEETNEEFDLTITSTPYFSNILKQISEHCDFCKETTIVTPIISTTLQDRLRTIVEYLGMEEFVQIFGEININYFTNDNVHVEELFTLLKNEISLNLKFIESNYTYQKYSILSLSDFEYIDERELHNSIYICKIDSADEAMSILKSLRQFSNDYNHVIFLYSENIDVNELELILLRRFGCFGVGFISVNDTIDEQVKKIWTVLQESVLIKKFKKLVKYKNIEHSKEIYIQLLDRIDPILAAPKHITLNTGESYAIEPFVYPAYQDIELGYIVDNANVTMNSNVVIGDQKGTTLITVFLKNNPYVFDIIDLEVIQKINIKEMEFIESEIVIGVNEKIELDVKFLPQNAQNFNEIKYISKNPEIASFDDLGFLVANNPGRCNIVAVVDNVVCSCSVEVKNRVQKIYLSNQHLHLKMGQTHDLGIEVYPKDAINNEIELVSLNNVVNVFGSKVKAYQIGEDDLIVRTKDNTVSATCKIIVESTLDKKETHHLTVGAILITVFNLVVQNIFVSILAIAVSYLSMRNQKSDTGLAIVISIINIIILFF